MSIQELELPITCSRPALRYHGSKFRIAPWIYDEIYADWRRDETRTTANGQRGAVKRTEVLLMNFEAEART